MGWMDENEGGKGHTHDHGGCLGEFGKKCELCIGKYLLLSAFVIKDFNGDHTKNNNQYPEDNDSPERHFTVIFYRFKGLVKASRKHIADAGWISAWR